MSHIPAYSDDKVTRLASYTTTEAMQTLSPTRDMRGGGRVLNVLRRLARTPGGGSNTNTRPARSRFTGSCNTVHIKATYSNDNYVHGSCSNSLSFLGMYRLSALTPAGLASRPFWQIRPSLAPARFFDRILPDLGQLSRILISLLVLSLSLCACV